MHNGARPSLARGETPKVTESRDRTAGVATASFGLASAMPMTVGSDDLTAAACLFRGLADRNRLAIVQRLALGEERVVDLVTHLALAQSTVSGHLACLRDCGLVNVRAEGRASFYSLAHAELLDLLASAERLLEATGNAVALFPNYGAEVKQR